MSLGFSSWNLNSISKSCQHQTSRVQDNRVPQLLIRINGAKWWVGSSSNHHVKALSSNRLIPTGKLRWYRQMSCSHQVESTSSSYHLQSTCFKGSRWSERTTHSAWLHRGHLNQTLSGTKALMMAAQLIRVIAWNDMRRLRKTLVHTESNRFREH